MRALPCGHCAAIEDEPHTDECLSQRQLTEMLALLEGSQLIVAEDAVPAVQSLDDRSLPTFSELTEPSVSERLEYLRGEIQAERISYSELAELQSLAPHIDSGDTLLLEWAGVPEFPDNTRWHIGSNMPGYMPMEEPYHAEGWKYAAESLYEEIERAVPEPLSWESMTEEEAAIQDAWTEALEELKALIDTGENVGELGWNLPLSGSEYDLGYSYWMTQCLEADCTEEDES